MGYQFIARKLVDRIYATLDNNDHYDVVLYGMEIAVSTIANLLLVAFLAWRLGVISETLVFCFFFMPYRMVSGGKHANTHFKCIMTFILSEAVTILIARLVAVGPWLYGIVAAAYLFSLIVCFKYGAVNKKVPDDIKQKHRSLSHKAILVDALLLLVILVVANKYSMYALIGAMALFFQSVALLPVWEIKDN